MNDPLPIFVLAPWVGSLGTWLAEGVFYVLAGVTVTAAVATVTLRNPVYAAVWFGMSVLGTAGLLLLEGAQFPAVATVLVYAGAMLVAFLFVLMLAQPRGRTADDPIRWEALLSALSGVLLVGLLSMTLTGVLAGPDTLDPPVVVTAAERAEGVLAEEHMALVGSQLFGRYLIAVEVAGTLLLAALVGAVVIVGKARGPMDASSRSDAWRRNEGDGGV